MTLQSYKPYARCITIVSAIIIALASLDASQVINVFPEYANQINTILMIAGLLAPAIAQEKRVVRAEDLIKEDYSENDESDESFEEVDESDESDEEEI
jgi:hypothetical protein